MGKKGRNDVSLYFTPTKTVIQQLQYSAIRSGSLSPTTASVTKGRAESTDWNAGKDDAKWQTKSQQSLNECPPLTEICTHFIALYIQLYVARETTENTAKTKPHPVDPHFTIVSPAAITQPADGSGRKEVIKKYQGYTYAHLAGSLALLPNELRDAVLLHALREATLRYTQIPAFLHAGLYQLNMSMYGRDFNQSFASHLLPKLEKIDTGETDNWEQIDEWTIHEAYKGCPNLTFLDLSNCIIYPHKLQEILNACPIKHLRLEHYPLQRNLTTPTSRLTSNHLESLDIAFLAVPFAFEFPALLRIDLSYNRSGSPASLASLAEYSRRLSYLNISGTENISSTIFMLVMQQCHNLRYLVAKDNTLRFTGDLLDLQATNTSLTSLNISGNAFVHYDTVLHIAQKYENLRTLDISHCVVDRPSALVAQCLMIRPLLEITFGGSSVPLDE